MIKTKKQILEHLVNTAYTKKSAHKILGFLVACCEIELGEVVNFKKYGADETASTFKDFVAWYESDEEVLQIYKSLVSDLNESLIEAKNEGDNETFKRVEKQLELIEMLGIDFSM